MSQKVKRHDIKQVICGFALLLLLSSIGGLFVELIILPPHKAALLFLIWAICLLYCVANLEGSHEPK